MQAIPLKCGTIQDILNPVRKPQKAPVVFSTPMPGPNIIRAHYRGIGDAYGDQEFEVIDCYYKGRRKTKSLDAANIRIHVRGVTTGKDYMLWTAAHFMTGLTMDEKLMKELKEKYGVQDDEILMLKTSLFRVADHFYGR